VIPVKAEIDVRGAALFRCFVEPQRCNSVLSLALANLANDNILC